MNSNTSPSKLRLEALSIVNDVFAIGSKYVKHQRIFAFFQYFFKPRLDKLILYEADEADIKNVMWSIKQKIDPMFSKMDTLQQIKDVKLNDKSLIENLMKMPQFAELEALLNGE